MLGNELPTWKQIFTTNKANSGCAFGTEANILWCAESSMSLKIILMTYLKCTDKKTVSLWLPDYFCAETIGKFVFPEVQLFYYPISEMLEPDWIRIKELKEILEPDVFLFVHYFGVYHDVSSAKNYCCRKNALLIEDCAHVSYDAGIYGKKGDFSIYSPHKIYPVPDGSILKWDVNTKNVLMIQMIDRIKKDTQYFKPIDKPVKWRVKKAIQKIVRRSRQTDFRIGTHYGDESIQNTPVHTISEWSRGVLSEYSHQDLNEIMEIRRDNLEAMNFIVEQIVPEIVPLIDHSTLSPYAAVYSLEHIVNKAVALEALQKKGLLVLFWPDLPSGLKNTPGHDNAKKISENLIVIPIHQGLKAVNLINMFSPIHIEKRCHLSVKWIADDLDRMQWDKLMRQAMYSNIPQDWTYGKVKEDNEHWKVRRALIQNEDKFNIGALQILYKEKLGVTYIIRVNRGPVFLNSYDTAANALEIIGVVKKQYLKLTPMFYAPNFKMTPSNLYLIGEAGWKIWNRHGYWSGIIDLQQSEEKIRGNLNSKWRNQLVASEKIGMALHNDINRIDEMLKLYRVDQKHKNYDGIPDKVLRNLYLQKESPLETYYVLGEADEIIAFDIIYKHSNTATYLVGWNSLEGRKLYLNNFLLYKALIDIKNKGYLYFDLGGIDYLYTESVAKFKAGMNPHNYRLAGELLKLW